MASRKKKRNAAATMTARAPKPPPKVTSAPSGAYVQLPIDPELAERAHAAIEAGVELVSAVRAIAAMLGATPPARRRR